MNILIKLEFYPNYMDKIMSFHNINKSLYDKILDFKNNGIFIENFYRVTKNSYKHLSSEKFFITEIEDKDKDTINKYLDIFGNPTDLLELIKIYLDDKISSENITTSDEDLLDSININNIIKLKLENNNSEINDIFIKNPHLINNEELTDLLTSE